MVAPDYHEEDGNSFTSSTTQIPSQHPLCHQYWEHRGGSIDLSTVPPTPLSHCRRLLSPIRTETPSNGYNLHSTPERIAALDREGSQGDGFGPAVTGGGVAGSAVVGGRVAGSGGGVTGSGVIVGGVAVSAVDVASSGVAVARPPVGVAGSGVGGTSQLRERGGQVSRMGRGVAGRGRRSRQSTGATAGGLARGGVKNYTPAKVESLLQTKRPSAQSVMTTGRLWPNCIAITMQFVEGLLSP